MMISRTGFCGCLGMSYRYVRLRLPHTETCVQGIDLNSFLRVGLNVTVQVDGRKNLSPDFLLKGWRRIELYMMWYFFG